MMRAFPRAVVLRAGLLVAGAMVASGCLAGAQQYEPLSASVRAVMQRSVADRASVRLTFASQAQGAAWLADMSRRLEKHIADDIARQDFLVTVQYEATRAGLDPQLVLGVIHVESRFRKYAVSKAGARGYMQVMPFWTRLLGQEDQNLFNLRTNLRYGCTILRHYLDVERGDVSRALARYNGTLGKPRYPDNVLRVWARDWDYDSGRPSIIIAPTRYLGDS